MTENILVHNSDDVVIALRENKTKAMRLGIIVNYNCSECGKETRKALFQFSKSPELICKSCKTKRTNLDKYGCENVFQNEDKKEQIRKTIREKYGCENPSQSDIIKEKKRQSFNAHYGCDCNLMLEETKDRIKQTNLNKYGVEYPSQNSGVKEKTKATVLQRYKVENPSQNEIVKSKTKETCLNKYGAECSLYGAEIHEKTKQTCLAKYGVSSPLQSIAIRDKAKNTLIEKYGVSNPMQLDSVHKKVFSHKREQLGGFLSNAEKKFADSLRKNGIEFESEVFHNGKHWDFKIRNILVEIDGEFYHGLLSDTDGVKVHGEKDHERFLKAKPYELLVIDSKKVDDGIDELLSMLKTDYNGWIIRMKQSLPPQFPFPTYDEERMRKDYNRLCNYEWNKGQRLGFSIVKNYHKSLWFSHVCDKPSPFEAWNNSVILDKCLRERFIYNSVLSSHEISDGFDDCEVAPVVPVFNPSLARHLADKYLNEFDEVFDPFSGFSGRMLGVCSLGKKYIGQDISKTIVEEGRYIINFLGLNAELSVADPLNSRGIYHSLFSSVPCGLKEKVEDRKLKNKTCDEWIDDCLKRFDCERYVFVVDNTVKYTENVVETVLNNGKDKKFVVLIDRTTK